MCSVQRFVSRIWAALMEVCDFPSYFSVRYFNFRYKSLGYRFASRSLYAKNQSTKKIVVCESDPSSLRTTHIQTHLFWPLNSLVAFAFQNRKKISFLMWPRIRRKQYWIVHLVNANHQINKFEKWLE